ncbi:collectin-12-like [Saccostrea echinata]|uniref:collectin-12-like n=1 Tax=Saccostrea echinata TaxID=191078 RepID=UPI002A8228E1|nr:collectin-12-like [Saccostrea echinata]
MVLHQTFQYEAYSHRIRTALYYRIPSSTESEEDEFRLIFPPNIYNDVISVTDCAVKSLALSATSFLYNLEEMKCDPDASSSLGTNSGFYHYAQQEKENLLKECRYRLSKRKTSFQEAKSRCESEGGYLVKIGNKEENDFIRKQFPDKSIWLGAKVSNSSIRWDNGEEVHFTDFVVNDPGLNDLNLLKVPRCIIFTNDGWETESCFDYFRNYFVCEFDQCVQYVQ